MSDTDLTLEVPDGTIAVVQMWVLEPGDNDEELARARAALAKEQAAEKPRAKLISELEAHITALEQLPDPPEDDEPAEPAESAAGGELVRARWIAPYPVFVNRPGRSARGIVVYGDELIVTAEQAASPATHVIPWDDAWEPDPALEAQCRLATGTDPQEG